MDHSPGGLASPASHVDRVDDELGAQMIGDRPADASAREHVDHGRAVDPSLARSMLRDVSHSELVRGIRGEDSFHVLFERGRQTTAAAAPPLAVMNALQPRDTHEPFNPTAPDPDSAAEHQLGMNPANPIGSSGDRMEVANRVDQIRILDITSRRPTRAPLVKARRRHLQHPADHRDGQSVAGEFMDQPEPYCGSTFSRAKYALTPRSFAISATGFAPDWASPTARRRNSSGFAAGVTDSYPGRSSPQLRRPGKPGQSKGPQPEGRQWCRLWSG